MSEMIDPATGQPSLLYYAGVFQNGNTSFSSPVWIYQNTAAEDTSLTMRSNVYTCQVVPVWSKLRQQSYATMLGGMTNSTFTGNISNIPVFLTGTNAPINPIDVNAFTHVPFTNQISTILIDAKHQYYQFLMPDSFPATQVSYTLPAQTDTPVYKSAIMPAGSLPYNGAEAELIRTLNAKYLVNGVIDYDKFSSDNAGGGTIGYLHGGILSFKNNILAYPNPNGNGSSYHYSIASNRIFEIRLVPNK
jgi:hypothetical protein